MDPYALKGTVTTATSAASAASIAVAARAFGPSSATRPASVSGPRELAMTTSYPFAMAARATWLPMCPAPMIPIVVMVAPTGCRGGMFHAWPQPVDTPDAELNAVWPL